MKRANWVLRASSSVVACAAIAGCGGIEPNEPPAGALHLTRAEFATSAPGEMAAPPANALQFPAALRWIPVTLPHALPRTLLPEKGEGKDVMKHESVTIWFRATVPASAVDRDLDALYVPRWHTWGYLSVYANRRLVYSSMAEDVFGTFNDPLLVRPLAGLGRAHEPLEIVIRMDSVRATGGALSTVWLGPVTPLRTMYFARRLLQNTVPQVTSIIFLLLGAFALLAWMRRRHESTQLLFFILSVLFYLRNLHYYIEEPWIPEEWFSWLTVNSLGWLDVVVYFFAFRLYGGGSRLFERILVGAMIVATTLTLPVPIIDTSLALISPLIYALFTAVSLSVTVMLSIAAWRARSAACATLAAILWLNLGLGVHDWLLQNWRIDIETIYMLPIGVIALFAMFLATVSRRYMQALAASEHASALLEVRLAARERELKQSYDKLREVEQAQLLSQERQRLMREMHDGLGSALMSSLIAVERGQMQNSDIVQVLRECVDDLKITIDSLEPVGDDLLILLATLRYRLEARLEAAGIALEWNVSAVPSLPWLNPTLSLHILRIVQEILTNVLKHARATAIRLTVRADGDHIAILVEDDGIGFDVGKVTHTGRGLANMRQRAALLGAAIDLESRPGATRVCLRLPVSHPAPVSTP